MDEIRERIRLAIKFNDVNEVEKTLEQIADPNIVVNSLGQTPLMLAVMKGSLSIVELLLAAGSNPNAQDYTGTTALMLIWDCDLEITKALIEAGADQRLRNKEGETALDIAKRKKQRKIMALLGFNRLPPGLFVNR